MYREPPLALLPDVVKLRAEVQNQGNVRGRRNYDPTRRITGRTSAAIQFPPP